MTDRSTPIAGPSGRPLEARGATTRRVDHLHFDRRARVWRTHAELIRHDALAAPSRDPLLSVSDA